MTDRNSTVAGVTIAEKLFGSVLANWSSPAAPDAKEIFAAIARRGVDPAFLLAIFWQESNGGVRGYATENKNPGNQRTSRTGAGRPVETVKGRYIRFESWLDGFDDLAFRLVDPTFVYFKENRRTIADIIYRFAPPADGNNTEAYILGVVKSMTTWQNAIIMPDLADIGFKVRLHLAATSDVGPVRPLSSVNKFVVHNTQGNMAGDEIELTSAGGKVASAHGLIAKPGETVFMVPLTKTAWTPGNDAVAETSINVELSGFMTDGYTDEQYTALANFFNWCVEQGCPIPAEFVGTSGRPGILGHQHVLNPNWPNATNQFGGVSGHGDPGPLFDWPRFIKLCKGGNNNMALPFNAFAGDGGALIFPLAPDHSADVVLNYGFKSAFLTLFGNVPAGDLAAAITRGVKMFGLPIENEVTDPATKIAVQKFENTTFIYNPALPEEWKVRTKRVN
jgi:hypothetical protein